MSFDRRSKSFGVASAINQVMHLDPDDQASMLDVIADYFTSPDHDSDGNDLDDDFEDDFEDDVSAAATFFPPPPLGVGAFSVGEEEDNVQEVCTEEREDAVDSSEEACEFSSTDKIVREALHRSESGSVDGSGVEFNKTDIIEKETIYQFLTKGCGCQKGHNHSPCSARFTTESVGSLRGCCAELSRPESDLVVIGQIQACTHEHQNNVFFQHNAKRICRAMFLFLHGISLKKFYNIRTSLRTNGLAPRIHGNTHRTPHNALPFQSTESVVRFLHTYAEQNAIALPGRIPGYSRSDIKLLPSSLSKRVIWKVFSASLDEDELEVSYCMVMKPMTDLCWQCQKNSSAILRSVNCSEEEKSAMLKQAEEHLRIVQVERSYYTTITKECSASIRAHYEVNSKFTPPPPSSSIPSNSLSIEAHFSFDYAQQIHFPSDPMQPGPINFLTTRKCSVFGMNCEAIPRQINFLTDECGEIGKGANAVISRVDSNSLGEKDVYLHADNCVGQNKNNAMMQYLMWRILTGRHSNITLSFLVVGHTKFSPDWCFGLFKRLYRRTKVATLADIAEVVDKSAVCNIPQVVCTEDATVPAHDWSSYLAPRFKRINGIKQYHHFRFSSTTPGIVFIKEHADTEEIPLSILKNNWQPDPANLPPRLEPKGLPNERQWYLFETIRPFCPEESRDVVCPLPAVPNPKRRRTPQPEEL